MKQHDNPHDILFKETFSRPDQAAALLRHLLPDDVSREIPWDRLEQQDSSLATASGEQRVALLYRVTEPPHHQAFLVLERVSEPEADTCYTLFQYTSALWERHAIRRGGRVVELPPVLPAVVVHGDGWRRRTLADFIQWPEVKG